MPRRAIQRDSLAVVMPCSDQSGGLPRGASRSELRARSSQRRARSRQGVHVRFSDPTDVEPTSDERELLLRYLRLQREMVVASTVGLTEDEARWRPDGDRLIPVIGIVNHLTHVEARWIDGAYARRPVAWRSEEEFVVAGDRMLAEVIDEYAARAETTEHTVRAAPGLDAPCVGPPGLGRSEAGLSSIDLRWVLLHLIEETAHHAGHAESTREMLDGHRSGW